MINFRWYEPISGNYLTFSADNAVQFRDECKDKAIDMRITTNEDVNGKTFYGTLWLQYKNDGHWITPRAISEDSDVMRLPARCSKDAMIRERKPSDIEIIEWSYEAWWDIVKAQVVDKMAAVPI